VDSSLPANDPIGKELLLKLIEIEERKPEIKAGGILISPQSPYVHELNTIFKGGYRSLVGQLRVLEEQGYLHLEHLNPGDPHTRAHPRYQALVLDQARTFARLESASQLHTWWAREWPKWEPHIRPGIVKLAYGLIGVLLGFLLDRLF